MITIKIHQLTVFNLMFNEFLKITNHRNNSNDEREDMLNCIYLLTRIRAFRAYTYEQILLQTLRVTDRSQLRRYHQCNSND